MIREAVATQAAPDAVGPYSQAMKTAGLVFVSGQLGLDPATGELQSGLEAQTRQAVANVGEVLAASGVNWSHVVKTTIYIIDISQFATVNAIYGEAMPEPPPARSAVQVAGLPKGGLVEIEAIAVRPE